MSTTRKKIIGGVLLTSFLLGANEMRGDDYPQLSNLPTVYIETEGGVGVTSKDTYVNATLRYVDSEGITLYDDLGIRGRGNSTWNLDKKPYRIKFSKKQKFLGDDRANAKSWTLLANHADKTLIRNAVAACIGTFAGQPFTAAAQFVDLVLNGTYLGNYQISDQVDIRKKRVNITEQEVAMTDDSDITGGYLLEVDGFATGDPVYFTTNKGATITIKSPDEDIIDNRQITYIKNYINSFESALFSANYADEEKGYRKYVDESTLLSWYISTELTGNPDGFWSTYIYKDKGDDKIYWGPLWDYDIAFNNCNRVGDVTKSLMSDVGYGSNLTKMWVERFWQDPWFATQVNEKWAELVDAGIEQHVLDYIDNIASEMNESQALNYKKWSINRRVYNELVLFDTYQEGIDYLKKFITNHTAYLTQAFQAAKDNTPVPAEAFEADTNYYYNIYNANTGLAVDIDESTNNAYMWSYTSSKDTQLWSIEPVNDYFAIVNKSTGLAITDASDQSWDGSYTRGTALATETLNTTNERQLWSFTPLTNDKYVIENVATGLAWNNSGGGSSNGNRIISWTSDTENANKPNRQWRFEKSEQKEQTETGVNGIGMAHEYRVTYVQSESLLRFLEAEGSAPLEGVANIYDMSGRLVKSVAISSEIDLSELSAGIYMLNWQMDGKTHTIKFTK